MNKVALLIPVFLLLVATEWWFVRKNKDNRVRGKNVALNMAVGAVDQVASIANFALFFWVLQLTYNHFRVFTLGDHWYIWILAYIAIDFVSYWYHRFSHRVALLWCGHVTHHSSGHFNLSNSFRTSPFQGLNRIPFWIILPVLGFSPVLLFTVFIVSGLYDFFLHTERFPRVAWLEYVFITPSLHRVHHGRNARYIDKNYGATFSFWDRMFGSFQAEEETVEFGILSKDYVDEDPLDAIFHHYRYLWKLMRNTSSWKNKVRVLLMPPDYVPADVSLHFKSRPVLETTQVLPKVYAPSLFTFSSLLVLAVLITRDLLSVSTLIYFALYALSGMIVSVRVFYGKIGMHFRRNEALRELLLAISGSLLIFLEPEFYGVLLAGSVSSLCFAGILLFGRTEEAHASAEIALQKERNRGEL